MASVLSGIHRNTRTLEIAASSATLKAQGAGRAISRIARRLALSREFNQSRSATWLTALHERARCLPINSRSGASRYTGNLLRISHGIYALEILSFAIVVVDLRAYVVASASSLAFVSIVRSVDSDLDLTYVLSFSSFQNWREMKSKLNRDQNRWNER